MSISLKPFTTFAIQHHTRDLVTVSTIGELMYYWHKASDAGQPVLMLGAGSNVLFVDDFTGTVILNRLTGVRYAETADSWLVHAAAGENWHDLVESLLMRNMPGLENLALIPGCVGSAPIQNIGAYGVELQQYCDYVDCLDLTTGQLLRLSGNCCEFGYRESIFKHQDKGRYFIVAVGLKLDKNWCPVLNYPGLNRLDPLQVTPRQLFDEVCRIRRCRLPDPREYGNAGSFFKNPLIEALQAEKLLAQYPDAPYYPQPDGRVKLAAGWLIEQCQLKGYRIGDAAVHYQQALVIVNLAAATSQQVLQLARFIRRRVGEKFAVWLDPEVRFIGSQGEIDATKAII